MNTMTTKQFANIEKFEADLWKIADNLRANSNLASNEYFRQLQISLLTPLYPMCQGIIILLWSTENVMTKSRTMEAYFNEGLQHYRDHVLMHPFDGAHESRLNRNPLSKIASGTCSTVS